MTYAAPYFYSCGTERVDSLDVSSLEGCPVWHDLYRSVEKGLHGWCDFVMDGGALERVFNFLVVIENTMNLLVPGGFLLSVVPCNNECGHGFYQFSPELYYRALSPANGFVVHEMLLSERRRNRTRWYRVDDPAKLGHCICFHNASPWEKYSINMPRRYMLGWLEYSTRIRYVHCTTGTSSSRYAKQDTGWR